MKSFCSGSDSELSTKPGLLVSGSDRPLGLSVVVETLVSSSTNANSSSRPLCVSAVVVEVVLLVNGNLRFTTFGTSFCAGWPANGDIPA